MRKNISRRIVEMPPKKKTGGSNDWVKDITNMYERFKFFSVTSTGVKSEEDLKRMRNFLKFRIGLFQEEFEEMQKAYDMNDAEEIVDASIDIMVIALGNLLLFGVDPYKAWDEVLRANNEKVVGDKPGRNNFGTPDLSKPSGWRGPSHHDNHGLLANVLQPHYSPILVNRYTKASLPSVAKANLPAASQPVAALQSSSLVTKSDSEKRKSKSKSK